MEERGLPVATHLLQHTLRSLCMNSQWVYAVFWRILPRSYPPPKWDTESGLGIYDRSKGNKRNWILVWEDGFCDFAACARVAMESKAEADGGLRKSAYKDEELGSGLQPDLFFKMSHEVYNYGEGLMGKVAADNSHKWIFRDPLDHEVSFLSPWHNSVDPHPRTWESQFKSGIQTIAVIGVGEGLVQLGATQKVIEDLNFVILLQRKFNYLQTVPGVFLPHPSTTAQSMTGPENPYNNSNNQRQLERCLSWNTTMTGDDHLRREEHHRQQQQHYSANQIMMMMMAAAPPPPPPPQPPQPVMPSMSSLQALLSKLPSVTNNSSTPPLNNMSNNSFLTRSFSCPRQSFSEQPIFLHNPHQQQQLHNSMEEFACNMAGTEDHESCGTAMDSYLSDVAD